MIGETISVTLTRREAAALTDFLTLTLNDPDSLDSSGLSGVEKTAVRRAHDKLFETLTGERP